MAAELHVYVHRVPLSALLQQVTERRSSVAVEYPFLLEEREGVGCQHLGPLVAVISRGVTACEDMGESVAHSSALHRGRDLHGSHRGALEGLYLALVRLLERMPSHVGQPERELTHVGVGRQIVLRGHDLLHQLGGDRLARSVMHGPAVEILFLRRPVLHDLRRQLHEVAVDARAVQRLVLALGQHAVQRVSELVQECVELIESEQRRRGLGRFGEVHHQRHQRTRLLAVLDARAAELGHPRARTFRLAGKEIEIQHGQKIAVRIRHIVSRHIGMIDRYILVGGERQSVKIFGRHEYAADHVVELQIRFHLLVVHGILLRLVLLGPVRPIPRHHIALVPFRGGVCVYRLVILAGVIHRLGAQLVEERRHRGGVLGHLLLENVIGIGLVTQQIGDLQTQRRDTAYQFRVVELAAQRARIVSAVELLLYVALRRIGHEGHIARSLEGHRPPLLAAASAASPSFTKSGSSATFDASVIL